MLTIDRRMTGLFLAAAVLGAAPARAQLAGHNLKGDTRRSANTSQAGSPASISSRRTSTTTRAPCGAGDGNELALRDGNVGANGFFAPIALYVTKAKPLGASYGVLVAPGWLNKRLEGGIGSRS